MSAPPGPLLIAAAAGLLALLGALHLVYTYRGPKLLPRDPATQAQMRGDTLRLSRQTTVWNAWIGFNASHGLGLLLFGALYGYFALWHADWLAQSLFLRAAGLVVLACYAVLARLHWFRIPLAGALLALALYAVGLALTPSLP
ncbi:hypothetical protein [Ramlibacter sp.]|uniref:LIC_13387 family protein n=1 Tax=Ramlibacter sp. TaxID=1917967 RepID=UPI0017EF3B68|nr:hypothetical protein [Ramlibacter sp.]MBA2673102.1 hypothetical protein [Ramlibacter sp.]